MSQNMGTIYYTVEARTAALLSAERDVSNSMNNMSAEMKKTDREAANLSTGMTRLASAIKLVLAATALREMAGMVQRYQEMAERVQMATRSTAEYEMVQKRLMETANGTYRALDEAQELYIRTADALRSMGYETAAAMDVQDSLSYSFVTNATQADRAQAAISAFSKSMNTGKVAADQWETIMSAVPTVINDVAEASGRSAAEVRALGAAGKLTARDLSEGLRQSLDKNAEAASKMANTLVDAGVRTRNALAAVLSVMEEQTGALDTLTNSIIKAADYMIEFGQDAESVENLLTALQLAATSTAAVVAGRLVSSLLASGGALYQNTVAARAKAAAELAAAQSAATLAAQNLISAQASARATTGLSTNAAAARALAVAQDQATAATTRLAAAQRTMAGTASAASVAVNGLRGGMALLGGPAGVALLAAGAIYTFASRADKAEESTIDLTRAVGDLIEAERELEKRAAGRLLTSLAEQAAEAQAKIDASTRAIEAQNKAVEEGFVRGADRGSSMMSQAERVQALTEARWGEVKALKDINEKMDIYRKRLEELNSYTAETGSTGGTGGGESDEPTTTEAGQKALAAMQQQIDLAQLAGVARAKLAAIQRLGAEATKEEREEAERLAVELYNIEEAQKAAEAAQESAEQQMRESARTAEELAGKQRENADTLAALREQIYQVSLSSEELAVRQAELSLNQYATPEQIDEVKRLAAELHNAKTAAEELARRRSAFGDDPNEAIKGNVSPLSGGAFDGQYARYEAEAEAERERYAAQLQRLQEAKDLEIEVVGGYYALEEQMAQQHADRMARIEQAKTQVLLASAEQGFGAMADIMKTAHGEQSAAYKAMFVVSKAFSTANAALALGDALSNAWKLPWPANLAAASTAAASMATIAANISSVSMGGGRQYGGPVAANSMYRINENGGGFQRCQRQAVHVAELTRRSCEQCGRLQLAVFCHS
jgi:tape measure domain-containing protein